MFYMNMGVFNEGEQAEAYKRRKEEEKKKREKEIEERDKRRYDSGSVGDKMTEHNPNHYNYKGNKEKNKSTITKLCNAINGGIEDMDRKDEADYIASHYNANNGTSRSKDYAYDAANKHLRKHNECGIFESVVII